MIAPGQSVLLKSTRERATVLEALDGDRFRVETALDRERFDVAGDELEIAGRKSSSSTTAEAQPAAGDIRLFPGTEGPVVQVAFLPAGEVDYSTALLNHSSETLVYAARLRSNLGQAWSRHGIIGPNRGVALGHLYRDLMNEGARIEVSTSRKGANGTDSMQEKSVGIKAKTFFKNTRAVDWFPDPVTVFDIFREAKIIRRAPAAKPTPGQTVSDTAAQDAGSASAKPIANPFDRVIQAPETEAAAEAGELEPVNITLPPPRTTGRPSNTPATASERDAPEAQPKPQPVPKPQAYTLMAAAEFPDALDLHVEQLVDNPKELDPGEIIELQLRHVSDYLDRAIRLGIDRVWLIHGKGTGALRNRVHKLLSTMGDLEGYQHKYHPKYDYGATEVVLR